MLDYLAASNLSPPPTVARVFRRGDFSHDPKKTLASEEASYSNGATAKKK